MWRWPVGTGGVRGVADWVLEKHQTLGARGWVLMVVRTWTVHTNSGAVQSSCVGAGKSQLIKYWWVYFRGNPDSQSFPLSSACTRLIVVYCDPCRAP
ncbi:hypothetical protein RHGRI_034103 [Rhododendron griersonianum]|uniref:Uncharacterized protein n=1 Tax=Rhododendron griersonianum TaxID=479676 RepID=A0AAV6I294_9ERIC|nr:hypothetical protein RHGRI_034103 [Rhododendron griersonianum]